MMLLFFIFIIDEIESSYNVCLYVFSLIYVFGIVSIKSYNFGCSCAFVCNIVDALI